MLFLKENSIVTFTFMHLADGMEFGQIILPLLMVRVEQTPMSMHQSAHSREIKQKQKKCLVLQSPITEVKTATLKTTRAQKSFITLPVSFLGLGWKVKQ